MSDFEPSNRQQRALSSAKRLQRQIERQQVPQTSGTYIGYEDGQYSVRMPDGSVVYGRVISTGVMPVGSLVSVFRPLGGTPLFDAMPR